MRSLKRLLPAILLFLLGTLLGCVNVWYAAARATIPLTLDAAVTEKRRLLEKKLGVDDVYLLELSAQSTLQVDRHVYERVAKGERLRKAAWSRQLRHGSNKLDLKWSGDFYGILLTMSGATLVLLVMLILYGYRLRRI